jgi:hypothetical protein
MQEFGVDHVGAIGSHLSTAGLEKGALLFGR